MVGEREERWDEKSDGDVIAVTSDMVTVVGEYRVGCGRFSGCCHGRVAFAIEQNAQYEANLVMFVVSCEHEEIKKRFRGNENDAIPYQASKARVIPISPTFTPLVPLFRNS